MIRGILLVGQLYIRGAFFRRPNVGFHSRTHNYHQLQGVDFVNITKSGIAIAASSEGTPGRLVRFKAYLTPRPLPSLTRAPPPSPRPTDQKKKEEIKNFKGLGAREIQKNKDSGSLIVDHRHDPTMQRWETQSHSCGSCMCQRAALDSARSM